MFWDGNVKRLQKFSFPLWGATLYRVPDPKVHSQIGSRHVLMSSFPISGATLRFLVFLTSAANTPMDEWSWTSGTGGTNSKFIISVRIMEIYPRGGGGWRGTYFIYLGRLLARASLHKSLGLDSFPSCAHGCSQKYLIPRSNFRRPGVRIASQTANYHPLWSVCDKTKTYRTI